MNRSVFAFGDRCTSQECYEYLDTTLVPVIHFGIGSLYVLVGMAGRFLLLLAAMRLSKTQIGYSYQLLVIGNDVVMDLMNVLYLFCFYWAWKTDWFRACFVCVTYAVHVSTFAWKLFMQNSAFMTLAVAADRLFALKMPVEYKQFNHRRMQIFLLMVGLLISVLSGVVDCFRYNVINVSGRLYDYENDKIFLESATGNSLSFLRIAVQYVCLMFSVVVSITTIDSYKKLRQHIQLIKVENAKQRQNERYLILLTVAQCVTSTITTTVNAVYYSLQYSQYCSCPCTMNIIRSIADGLIFSNNILNVFLCILISKPIRVTLRNCFQELCKKFVLSFRSIKCNSF